MISIPLNGRWTMKNTKDSAWIEASVPGSVYSDLITRRSHGGPLLSR